ncbi:MAG: TraM recognition domain-containing protein, partial [Bacteroidota bacterium]
QADNLDYGCWQVFEMEKLMNTPAAVAPTLNYIFHKLEQRFTGAPTLLNIDEGWMFLDNSGFADKIREWLKVLRKANVSVIFATQSLGDIQKSVIAQTIMEACHTKIYLPNPNALSHEIAPIYESFGLNDTERNIIACSIPKRQYYYKSLAGSRLFELALGPIALAYCAASSKEDQNMAMEILKKKGKAGFNEEWLRYKKLPETADSYREFMEDATQKEVAVLR